MTIFWNFLQDHRYFKERKRADTLEVRVKHLEKEITDQRDLMKKLLYELETRLGDDLDGDGQIGVPKPKTIKVRQTRNNKHIRKQLANQKKK